MVEEDGLNIFAGASGATLRGIHCSAYTLKLVVEDSLKEHTISKIIHKA